MIEVQAEQKRSAIFIGLLLLTIGIILNLSPTSGPVVQGGTQGSTETKQLPSPPVISPTSTVSSPAESTSTEGNSTSRVVEQVEEPSSSPEVLLSQYTQGLTDRDLATVKRIFPKGDEVRIREWLQGASSGKAPLSTIQIVGQPVRTLDSINEIILRATLKYCREDMSGSTDIKNYIFIRTEEGWKLDGMSAPENVISMRCY